MKSWEDMLAVGPITITTSRGPVKIDGMGGLIRLCERMKLLEAINKMPRGQQGMTFAASDSAPGLWDPGPLRGQAKKPPIHETGAGLAAKYPDATCGGAEQEPVTCDVGADWDD